MSTKTANLYARIEPELKEQAEMILSSLGIPASNAITMFYRQIVLNNGLPFELKLPTVRIPDVSKMSEAEISEELLKGYADMESGRTAKAADVFADIRSSRKI